MARLILAISLLLSGGVGLAYRPLMAQDYIISTYAGGPLGTIPVSALNVALDPGGIATDATGNVYFVNANAVFKLDSRGLLTRIAGTSSPGYSGDGEPAINAKLYTTDYDGYAYVSGLALDAAGNLYLADSNNFRVRKISPDGVITTIAGDGTSGFSGDGGPALSAQFMLPSGVAVDALGNVYVVDLLAQRVRKISPDGIITTVAGTGTRGYSGDGAPATEAQLNTPLGIALDGAGNLFIADSQNHVIRMVAASGTISTVAGTGTAGYSGDGGPATSAQLTYPTTVVADSAGNLFIGASNAPIRRVSSDGTITSVGEAGIHPQIAVDRQGTLYASSSFQIRQLPPMGTATTVAGNGTPFYAPFGGDGGPALGAQFNMSCCGAVAVNPQGTLYIADAVNNRVRQVSTNGIITTVAGNGAPAYDGDGKPAVEAQLARPQALAINSAGELYIADTYNFRVRKISREGIITTVAGNGTLGHTGDGGPATSAQIGYVFGMALDAASNLYIADILYVRKIAPDGTITTVLDFSGNARPSGLSGGNVLAVAVDSAGNLYATDHVHHRVLKVSPEAAVTVLAGTGTAGYSGDAGPAANAQLATPITLTVDAADNLYIGEWGNRRIRKVTPAGIITTIAGDGTFGDSGDGGPATGAALNASAGLAAGPHGEIYLAEGQYAVRVLQPVSPSSPSRQESW